jgi:spore coat protein U-like protein
MRTVRFLCVGIVCLVRLADPACAQLFDPRSNCQIRVDPIDFGTYSTVAAAPTDSTGHVEIKCGGEFADQDIAVILSPGASGHYHDRTLLHGAEKLEYNLYVDPGHRVVAGNGSQGTSPLIPLPGEGTVKEFRAGRKVSRIEYNVYGRIFPRQSVAAGAYVDEITVTVVF